jgi:hypothetical protein
MEFIHLGKLIQLVFVPLVRYCPQDCWDERMLELLEHLFGYCEDIFYHAWFYKTRILQPIAYRIPRYVSDTDTRGIRLRYVSMEYPEKIDADKSNTFSDMYWATMAH